MFAVNLKYVIIATGLLIPFSNQAQNANNSTGKCYLKTLLRWEPFSTRVSYLYDNKNRIIEVVRHEDSEIISNDYYQYKKDSVVHISSNDNGRHVQIEKYQLNEKGFAEYSSVITKSRPDPSEKEDIRENDHSFEYDEEGHLIRKVTYKNAQYSYEENYYWENGNLVKIVNPTKTMIYEYFINEDNSADRSSLFGRTSKGLTKSMEYTKMGGKTGPYYKREDHSYEYNSKGYISKKHTTGTLNDGTGRKETFTTEYFYDCF